MHQMTFPPAQSVHPKEQMLSGRQSSWLDAAKLSEGRPHPHCEFPLHCCLLLFRNLSTSALHSRDADPTVLDNRRPLNPQPPSATKEGEQKLRTLKGVEWIYRSLHRREPYR